MNQEERKLKKTGTYLLKPFSYADQQSAYKVQVEIIGKSAERYHVRFLERGPLGQPIGTTYWPRKRNVINITEVAEQVVPNIRLPYKD